MQAEGKDAVQPIGRTCSRAENNPLIEEGIWTGFSVAVLARMGRAYCKLASLAPLLKIAPEHLGPGRGLTERILGDRSLGILYHSRSYFRAAERDIGLICSLKRWVGGFRERSVGVPEQLQQEPRDMPLPKQSSVNGQCIAICR